MHAIAYRSINIAIEGCIDYCIGSKLPKLVNGCMLPIAKSHPHLRVLRPHQDYQFAIDLKQCVDTLIVPGGVPEIKMVFRKKSPSELHAPSPSFLPAHSAVPFPISEPYQWL
jgi:hypothetical protein